MINNIYCQIYLKIVEMVFLAINCYLVTKEKICILDFKSENFLYILPVNVFIVHTGYILFTTCTKLSFQIRLIWF